MLKPSRFAVILLLLLLLLVHLAPRAQEIPETFDLIVYGAEPEGVAAAVTAARGGLRVLLAERRDAPGGLMTSAMLNSIDMNRDRRGSLVTRGFFMEFYEAVGQRDSFDVGTAARFFQEVILREEMLTFMPQASLDRVMVNAGRLEGLVLNGTIYQSGLFVDASADADLAAASGAPFTIGQADINEPERVMASTLVFGVNGVNWDEIVQALTEDGDPLTGANSYSAWGFAQAAQRYSPAGSGLRLRALNMGRQDARGSVLINALLVFGVDGLCDASKLAGLARAKEEIPNIVAFLRREVPGCQDAEAGPYANELYIRESRHLRGDYTLTVHDVMLGRDFWDKIAVGAYPIDIQPTAADHASLVIGRPDKYAIPYRCLLPKNLDNLLVVGRSASYTSIAAGSARVIPVGMAEGQAAGAAAVLARRAGIDLRALGRDEVLIRRLQEDLRAQGAYLPSFSAVDPRAVHPEYEYALALMEMALIEGGYNNDLRLDQRITRASMANLLSLAVKRSFLPEKYRQRLGLGDAADSPATLDWAAAGLLALFEERLVPGETVVRLAQARGLIPPDLAYEGAELTRGEAYRIICWFLDYLRRREEAPSITAA